MPSVLTVDVNNWCTVACLKNSIGIEWQPRNLGESIEVCHTLVEVVTLIGCIDVYSRHKVVKDDVVYFDIKLAVLGDYRVVGGTVHTCHIAREGDIVVVRVCKVGVLHIGCTQRAANGLEALLVAAFHILKHPLAACAHHGIYVLASVRAVVIGVNGNEDNVALGPLVQILTRGRTRVWRKLAHSYHRASYGATTAAE